MKSILATLLLTTAVPALAVVPEKIEATTEEAPAADPTKAMMDGIMAMFADIFDTSKLGPVDPARLRLAEVTATKLLPNGAYAKIMEDMMGSIMTPLFAKMPGMTDIQISTVTGASYEDVEKLTAEQKEAIGQLIDPFAKQRGEQTMAIIKPMLSDAMAKLEPPIRTGMSRAYARRFSIAELTAINGFFATPAGGAFAQESFRLQADPEVMQATFKALPALLTGFMGSEADMKAKFDALPKEKKLSDLSSAELKKLSDLLGITVQSLEEHRDLQAAVVEAEAEIAGINPYTSEIGTEPWYSAENWNAGNRKKVTQLADAYVRASEKSETASARYEEAQSAAVDEARQRYLADGWQAPAATDVVEPPADT